MTNEINCNKYFNKTNCNNDQHLNYDNNDIDWVLKN